MSMINQMQEQEIKRLGAQIERLTAELEKWKLGCETNADCCREAVRKLDEYRLKNMEMREAILRNAPPKDCPFCESQPCNDCLVRARIQGDCAHALSSDCGKQHVHVRELEETIKLLTDIPHSPESAWYNWLARRDIVKSRLESLIKEVR